MKLSEKITKKQIISIAISIIIILLVATNIFRINYTKNESKYIAENGVLDLKDWDVNKDQLVELNGQWEFYSGKLIDPAENFDKEKKEYANVPGDWKTYLKNDGLKNGSATYRLVIKVPRDTVYGIKAKTIRSSYRIYLNGEEIAQAGNPSINEDEFKAASKYKLGVGNSFDEEIELIVHVTSLNYRSGGIHKSLEIGLFESMLKIENRNLVLDALVVSICLTLGLYFFTMYLQRSKETYLAYFSGVTLFMGLYLSTMNEQILSLAYEYSQFGRVQIQIFSMILTSICFLRFTHYFFEEYSNKKIVNKLTIFMLSILSLSLLIIVKEEIALLGYIQIVTVISITMSYIYMFYILIRAMYGKTAFIEYIIVIMTSIASYWTILYIKTFTEIDLGNTPVFIILLMMFSVAGLTSHRLQVDYKEAKQLSRKLERYDLLKNEFFAKASLQFKGVLEIILDSIKNLLEGKDGVLNITQQESLFQVNQEIKGLRRIADDLMYISLIKTGEIEESSNPIDVYRSVEEILQEIEILIEYDDSIIIKNYIPKDFPTLKADSNKFRQIIYELIENSIKHTKHGEILIYGDIIKGQGEIKVKDTGTGIEEEYLKEIFDIFYQKNESEDLEEGLGIGLHIVKKLVEIQGGKIYAESIYGEGTVITFTLPLYTEEDRKNNTIELDSKFDLNEISNSKLRGEKILIVEGGKENQKLLRSIVKDLDYQITLARTGKEALEILEREKIDLIVLDFMLQDMTSKKLCNEIRKKYSIGELPILILTASGRTIDLISSFDYGVNDFQRKPVDPEELKSRIQSLLLIKASAEEGLEKEFQYFYSQISPHFLYNTLNSIIGLSYKDSQKTRQALNNLSIFLRGKLDIHRKKAFVTLESELDLVMAYLEIEGLRYGEKLEVVYNIEEGLKADIPPLTLQPIVENAVNHGVASEDRGRVEVITKKEYGFISIIIKDNGRGMTVQEQRELLEGNGKGIGFKNVMERIKLLKGANLTLESELGEGTKVEIIIPEVKSSEGIEDNFS